VSDTTSRAARARTASSRLRSEVAEGVISAAIVVLIMAILGAAMWGVFNRVFTDATGTVEQKVGEIG
jgi:hypothetical protein